MRHTVVTSTDLDQRDQLRLHDEPRRVLALAHERARALGRLADELDERDGGGVVTF